VEELFDKKKIDQIWRGDPFHYYLNKLPASSGMRLGEIQALRRENIRPGEIEVCHSWDRSYGLKSTKSGTKRIVPISDELYQGIMAIAETNTEGPYIFSVDGK
jgi:integrase